MFDYFPKGFPVQEFLEDLAASGEFGAVSEPEICERMIRYADAGA